MLAVAIRRTLLYFILFLYLSKTSYIRCWVSSMGCCPSSSFDQPLTSPPLRASSITSVLFDHSDRLPSPTALPPPYSVQPLSGHKSLTLPSSGSSIPLRGWGESVPGPIAAWGPVSSRNQQRLETQVQFLQQFISILQQESAGDRVNVQDSIQPVESLGDLNDMDGLPALSTQRNAHIPPLIFPMSPCVASFPVSPISSNSPLRLPPLDPDSNDPEVAPCPPHTHRSHERKKRKKRRRRRSSVAPSSLSPEYPVLTLQRPFTSPNLRATLASPLGANQTDF